MMKGRGPVRPMTCSTGNMHVSRNPPAPRPAPDGPAAVARHCVAGVRERRTLGQRQLLVVARAEPHLVALVRRVAWEAAKRPRHRNVPPCFRQLEDRKITSGGGAGMPGNVMGFSSTSFLQCGCIACKDNASAMHAKTCGHRTGASRTGGVHDEVWVVVVAVAPKVPHAIPNRRVQLDDLRPGCGCEQARRVLGIAHSKM